MDFSKLKVLGYTWHEGHQHELAKVGFQYILQKHDTKFSSHGNWRVERRPFPANAIECSDWKVDDVNLMILHLDEECCVGNSVCNDNWRGMYEKLRSLPFPRITIMHGTPKSESNAEVLRQVVGDDLVVCNSEQARLQWGFRNSVTIIHGIDPDEFPLRTCKHNNKIAMCYGFTQMRQKPEYYGFELFKKISLMNSVHFGKKCESFEEYKKQMSSWKAVLCTANNSPMPRARTEAMMMGVPVISTPYHDWRKYVVHGVNGFIIENEDDFFKVMSEMTESKLLSVGLKGRETAIKYFNIERYIREWKELIEKVLSSAC